MSEMDAVNSPKTQPKTSSNSAAIYGGFALLFFAYFIFLVTHAKLFAAFIIFIPLLLLARAAYRRYQKSIPKSTSGAS